MDGQNKIDYCNVVEFLALRIEYDFTTVYAFLDFLTYIKIASP